MSTFLVEVRKIQEIRKHSNADKLQIGSVEGLAYQFVVGKDMFHAGDEVVYFPIDSVLSQELINHLGTSKFMAGHAKNRFKTVRLRGEVSQGYVTPVKIVKDFLKVEELPENLTEVLGVIKYEPPEVFIKGANLVHLPPHVHHYDIENVERHPNILKLLNSQKVYIQEKLEGCFTKLAKVTLADGTNKKMKDIKKGDLLLGVDKNMNLTINKVINTFMNGKTEDWIKIIISRNNDSSGNSQNVILCTPQHNIFNKTKNRYMQANELTIGDEIISIKKDIAINSIQEQVILGKLLGDGYLRRTNLTTSCLTFSHSDKNSEYFYWTKEALGDIVKDWQGMAISGKGSNMLRGRTIFSCYIKQKFSCFYPKDSKKIVPFWVIKEITPIAIAFWYMDDGNLDHSDGQNDRAKFSTCSFDDESLNNLIKSLQKFNIESYIKRYNNFPYIVLNADNADKLFLLIAPYIPKGMQYKLPSRYRGHDGWIPKHNKLPENIYKPIFIKQTVVKIESYKKTEYKYDLETETHNYFVSNVLVHNSHGFITKTPNEEIKIGQRNHEIQCLSESEEHTWWKIARNEGYLDLINKIHQEKFPDNTVTIRFECLGNGIQGNWYQIQKHTSKVFELEIDGIPQDIEVFIECLGGVEEFNKICAPILFYDGMLSDFLNGKTIQEASNGKSLLNPNKLREGIVIRPMKRTFIGGFGDLILKMRDPIYLATIDY